MVIDKNIAQPYDSSITYITDDKVIFNNKMYQCIADSTTGEFNIDDWKLVYLVDILDNMITNSILANSLAPEYDNTATYNVGDTVLYNRILYMCIEEVTTAEEFDETKWEEIYLSDYIVEKSPSNKSASGSFVIEATGETDIIIGFKPSKISTSIIYSVAESNQIGLVFDSVYNEDVSTTQSTSIYGLLTMGNYNNSRVHISEVNDTGFKFNVYQSDFVGKTVNWFAIG